MGDFEEALDAVRRRLDRARDADDPALMLDPAAVAEADRLEALLSGDGADAIPAMIALGWVYSYRYSALSDDAGRRKYFDRAIESFTTCFCLLAVFRDGDIPEIPAALMPPGRHPGRRGGRALARRGEERSGSSTAGDDRKAVAAHRRGHRRRPSGPGDLPQPTGGGAAAAFRANRRPRGSGCRHSVSARRVGDPSCR